MYFIFLLSLRPPQRRSFPGLRPDGSRLAFLESPAPSRQQGAPRLSVSALPKRGPRATGRWRARRWRTPPAQLGIRQLSLADTELRPRSSVSAKLSWLGPGGPGTGARTLRPPPAAVALAAPSPIPPSPPRARRAAAPPAARGGRISSNFNTKGILGRRKCITRKGGRGGERGACLRPDSPPPGGLDVS